MAQLLSEDRIVLADFGLACAIGSAVEEETKEALGEAVGVRSAWLQGLLGSGSR